jgi:uncharacterized protein YcfJ
MGLMKLSGDIYDYQEDSKMAMSGVSNLDQAPVPNPLADEQLAPVNGAPPPPNLPPPAPGVPAVKEPEEIIDPVEGPKGDNLFSPTPKSFKELPKTTLASYRGTKMSKLNAALLKLAMTEGDFLEFEEDPYKSRGTLGSLEEMENYNMPADYSNYLAANAPAAQGSYDIGEAEMADIYGDLPENAVYLGGGTTDADVAPGMYAQEVPYAPSDEAMGYSAYGYAPSDYDTMGYSSDPGVYDNYYQMYASPEAQTAEYQDVQTQAVDPEQQALADQQAVYDESYSEVYNYLVQMGYSPEEAQAAVPSLLGQVNVQAPQAQEVTKTASYMFKQAASDLVSEYIDAGYSPYQAREMSIMVVVPHAEKYASQGRLIGGGIGALVGGTAGHAMYDDEGDIGGALISAAIGGGLGAAAPGRFNQYAAKRLISSGGASKEVAKLRAVEKEIMAKANADQLALLNAQLKATGRVPNAAKTIEEAKLLAGTVGHDFGNLGKAQRKAYGDAFQRSEALKTDPASVQVIQDFAAAEAAAARSRDLKGAIALAIPGTMLHRYAASHGGDNFVDNTFDAADYLGDRVGDAASTLRDNPEYLAAAAGGYGLMRGGSELATHLKNRRAEGPKKGRTKKASMEMQAQELQKLASWAARVGGGLVGSVVGGNIGDSYGGHRDNWWGGAAGAVAGGLAGAGLGQLARAGLRAGGKVVAPRALKENPTRTQKIMNTYEKMLSSPMEKGFSGGVGGAIAGGTAGGVGEMYREYQKADTDPYYDSQYLRALTRGGVLGAAAGGLGGLGLGAKRVAIMGSLYPAALAAKGGLYRTGDALGGIDLTMPNPLSEESMRAFGQGFGDIANVGGDVYNVGLSGAQAVGLTPAQAQQKGNAAVEWAKENPSLAGAAALGTAGALYGGYRAFSGDDEQTSQQKLEALRRKRNV